MTMVSLGLGSTIAAILLGRATGRYDQTAQDKAELHGRGHGWIGRALIFGGVLLSAILLPGAFVPSLFIFAALWLLNGVEQALIDSPAA